MSRSSLAQISSIGLGDPLGPRYQFYYEAVRSWQRGIKKTMELESID